MPNHGRYQTFVTLDPYERWIIRALQHGMSTQTKRKRKPPMNKIIGMVIRGYWEEFSKASDPQRIRELIDEVPPPAGMTFPNDPGH